MKKEPKLGNSGGVFNVEMKLRTLRSEEQTTAYTARHDPASALWR